MEKLRKKGLIDADAEIDESGIRPDQVISFGYSWAIRNIIFTLLYRDSEGKVQMAAWNFRFLYFGSHEQAKAFLKAFLNWMSTAAVAAQVR